MSIPSPPLLFTLTAKVKNWQGVATTDQVALTERLAAQGITQVWIYRNLHDATQMLVIAELPGVYAVCALTTLLNEQWGAECATCQHEAVWEVSKSLNTNYQSNKPGAAT